MARTGTLRWTETTTVDGHDRLTDTEATVGIFATRSTAPPVSTRASGVPMGTAAAATTTSCSPGSPSPVTVTDRVASTGCQVDYGTEDECLPASPPAAADTDTWAAAETASTRWSCALLRRMFPDGLALRVAAYDPLGLDHDGDGVACDPGDGA